MPTFCKEGQAPKTALHIYQHNADCDDRITLMEGTWSVCQTLSARDVIYKLKIEKPLESKIKKSESVKVGRAKFLVQRPA